MQRVYAGGVGFTNYVASTVRMQATGASLDAISNAHTRRSYSYLAELDDKALFALALETGNPCQTPG